MVDTNFDYEHEICSLKELEQRYDLYDGRKHLIEVYDRCSSTFIFSVIDGEATESVKFAEHMNDPLITYVNAFVTDSEGATLVTDYLRDDICTIYDKDELMDSLTFVIDGFPENIINKAESDLKIYRWNDDVKWFVSANTPAGYMQ